MEDNNKNCKCESSEKCTCANNKCRCDYKCSNKHKSMGCGGSSGIYFLALVGAAIYYIQQATSFGAGVVGILKALVWPAMVVYQLLGFLGM